MSHRLATTLLFLFATTAVCAQQSPETWTFAVSGDSRNCGDVVMPAIAKSVLQNHAAFYWHLGDFRAMYDVDEDMQHIYGGTLTFGEYRQIAWTDFIENQVHVFEPVPVRLGIGNHELIGKTPADYLSTFGYWLDTPEIRAQRASEFWDGSLRTYYHWKEHNVDFIYLDNSADEGFDDGQMEWFERVLAADKKDAAVKTLVVGMHRALPNSLACGHSMNGDKDAPSPKGIASGRRAYLDLVQWRKDTQKRVYVLASHSHFFMDDIYQTDYWKNHSEVLPGWIVGTAGARRYKLPDFDPAFLKLHDAQSPVWGYLLATVAPTGDIKFDFTPVGPTDLPATVKARYGDFIQDFCVKGNLDNGKHDPPDSCNDK
ncbi:MAG TPA: hypothetical protein VE377_18550 [Candidatus Dormibacteraeota bacterium]|nr:hypothetical protein [Candidatus Dormibacteraeota bacterium]